MIRVLSPDVVNQIAAGEVLERPANLVKELVENSIDAQSTQIEIDIDHGGRFLKISDNGNGMGPEDLKKSTLRHATSKIAEFKDLWSLSTYGFRGEALASAASVSQMTIQSKTKNSEKSFVLKSLYGVTEDVYEQSSQQGTVITIDQLFENVPARLKFLKTESAEVSQILKVIKSFALSHPEIEFKVRVKNVLKLFYPKTESQIDRISSVLENSNLFEANQKKTTHSVHAFYSSPQDVTKTAQNIWIFVQKRWVQDRSLQRAILDAYQNLLMHGEYPYCVLLLDCDPQIVDVNIHPTKSQVKFQEPSEMFRSVYYTLRESLEKAPWLKQLFQSNQAIDRESQPLAQSFQNSIEGAVEKYSIQNLDLSISNSSEFERTHYKQKNSFSFEPQAVSITSDVFKNDQIHGERFEPKNNTFLHNEPVWSSLQVLSQLNQTYILAQSRYALFLIDQHASHERVMFERLMKSWRDKKFEIQSYLIPVTVDLASERVEAILKNKEEFSQVGIELDQSGPESISIYSGPMQIKESALVDIVIRLSQDLLDMGGGFHLQRKISDIFSSMACHSAIRAGQSLSLEEMQQLLVSMDEFPLSSFCPHGRPVFKQITFLELDKDFGRIV